MTVCLAGTPAGVGGRLMARAEAHLPPIEPAGTPDTGDPATAAAKRAI